MIATLNSNQTVASSSFLKQLINTKRAHVGVFESYAAPTVSGASEFLGTVIEVLSGDTLVILPNLSLIHI